MFSVWIVIRGSKHALQRIEAIFLCDELLIVEKECLFSIEEYSYDCFRFWSIEESIERKTTRTRMNDAR